MPKLVNALQLKKGVRADHNRMGTVTQPIQFTLSADKDEEWAAWNMDWLEMQGMKQVRQNAPWLLKNYKLANGIIDKTDYIVEENNEHAEMLDVLTKQDDSAMELRFYPIIPNVVNVLTSEFAKRNDKITYRAVDDHTYNEMLHEKQGMIEQTLMAKAEQDMQQTIASMGIDMQSEEGSKQAQQMMSPENLKTLPQIEQFFKKEYRPMIEQWATHQHNVDTERFSMKELETIGFKDMLTGDREFWHFKMEEDDYDIELWNPLLTFYHKSPGARYVSQGNFVGNFEMLTVADVIDKHGHKMNKAQLESLQEIYPVTSTGYIIPGLQNDGSFYDATRSPEWNQHGPSLGMRQFNSFRDNLESTGDDIIESILNETEDFKAFGNASLLRATTAYWKTQRMIGHLTKIGNDGIAIEMVIDERYKVTDKPQYDNTVMPQKSRETLQFGEHIDWIWINQTWGGLKIGPNRAGFSSHNDTTGFAPIYLDLKPVKFQFKGDFTLYGCKLPVEGAIFSNRNSRSTSLVDKMKPFQIGFNLVNNQIADILVDELGTVILLDQNALPKHSQGEDWGKNSFANAYVAMKDFQMLPLDTSITNTENATNFQHYQVLNLEQTNRLMSRVQLGTYFKSQCFETIGITPQRLGAVGGQETATGVEQAVNQSYTQTEMYFVQHSEYLMPRVHQMRTDLAQYYHSKKPSVRLQYMTSLEENAYFEINGTELLARDLNVFASTKVNNRQIIEQFRSLAMSNNTAGASIFDLGNIIKADSLAEITVAMKTMEEKAQASEKQKQDALIEAEKTKQEGETTRQEAELRHEAEEKALDRENNLEVAKVRSAGFTAMKDMDGDGENDYIKTLEYLDKKNAANDDQAIARQRDVNNQANEQIKNNIKREELGSRERIAQKQLQIASTNKNKYDK
jgi:hypothetical protein